MPQLNKIIDFLSEDVLNGTGEKTANALLRYVFIAFLSCMAILATILLLGLTVLLLQSYLTGHISDRDFIFDALDVTQGIREFNYRCLWLIGFLMVVISPLLRLATQRKVTSDKYSYPVFIIGTLVVFLSICLGVFQKFITFDSGEYIWQAAIIIGVIGNTFTQLKEKYAYLRKYFAWTMIIGVFIRVFSILSSY